MDADELCAKRVGTVLRGKWTLERLLGVGGMAAVYVARHKIGRLDAIKILHPDLAHAEQVRKRFEQEAHVLSTFGHPGAVEVRDLETTEDGAPFIVMELLEGKPLADDIRDRVPTPEDALRVADEVLDVLAAAHERGIIHRDIKPDNLFVTTSGAIKVLDFGIAQLRAAGVDGSAGGASRAPVDGSAAGGTSRAPIALKTKTGTTLGTVAYMPPEQLKGLDIDARADLYAVGATMFRMLVGRPPHQADSDVELMMKVLTDPAPRLASVVGARADVARIVDRALAFDRDARFPDARAMQSEVRAARKTPSAEIAAPPPVSSQDSVATVTPARLSPPAPAAIASQPTMLAAPESALLREASPASRSATRVSSQAEPARSSGALPASKDERTVAGIPIVWLIAAGAIVLVLGGALVTALAIAAFRAHEPVAQPSAAPTVTAPVTAASSAPEDEREPEDEDRPPGPGPRHPPGAHGGPKGHGKHHPPPP